MNPIDRVRSFVDAMLMWESTFHSQKRDAAYKADPVFRQHMNASARVELQAIYDTHLTKAAGNRLGASRLDILMTGRPAEYAQRVLAEDTQSSGGAAYVMAETEKGLKTKYRYEVAVEDGQTKIRDVCTWHSASGKWVPREGV
ncbi:Uncharacterised protein [Bordetella ansorpii]|uniref:NTF2 fold immunity protein domain-containing protein n=1 Tax=Bordetella ansorpii TaxID=288768 RepID=A0A157NWP8_9BORD|nr:NTF2 fold immunity protein [Bordetella ansorpii]SAI25792.1 Uncharacterised protein [Bordetella ansorpii]